MIIPWLARMFYKLEWFSTNRSVSVSGTFLIAYSMADNTTNSTLVPSPLISPAILTIGTTLCSIELIVQSVAILISAFNFCLLYSTILLHPNLKCILLVQSITIASHELNRVSFCILKFAYGDMFFGGALPVQIMGMLVINFRNLISHVLMAERVMATVYFRKYENYKRPHFSVTWIGILLAITVWFTYSQGGSFWTVTPITFANVCIAFVLGVIEILTLAAIYFYNLNKYKYGIYLTLNERFQLSENIRTAKQLAPTLFLHYFNANSMTLVLFLIYFGVFSQPYQKSLAFLLLSMSNAICCSVIEVTVITHHPMIKRKAIEWIRKLFNYKRGKVEDSSVGRSEPEMPKDGHQLLSIYGDQLLNIPESDHHFAMLQQNWK